MTLIILLFALGILLLAVEVIVPGAILGSIGGLMMFGGCVMAFMEYGTRRRHPRGERGPRPGRRSRFSSNSACCPGPGSAGARF